MFLCPFCVERPAFLSVFRKGVTAPVPVHRPHSSATVLCALNIFGGVNRYCLVSAERLWGRVRW